MQIFVRGLGWDTYTIDIEPEDTVLTLKHRVQDRTGIRSTLQRLIFAGKQLEDKGPNLCHTARGEGIILWQTIRSGENLPFISICECATKFT